MQELPWHGMKKGITKLGKIRMYFGITIQYLRIDHMAVYPGDGAGDTAFTQAINSVLVWRVPESLRNLVTVVLCKLDMLVGDGLGLPNTNEDYKILKENSLSGNPEL